MSFVKPVDYDTIDQMIKQGSTNPEIQEATGRSPSTIKRRRAFLTIPVFDTAEKREARRLMGTMRDSDIAKATGLAPRWVGEMRKRLNIEAFNVWDEHIVLLRSMLTSKEVAKRIGSKTDRVRCARFKRGLTVKVRCEINKVKVKGIDWEAVTDAQWQMWPSDLAALLGTNKEYIYQKRKEMGIKVVPKNYRHSEKWPKADPVIGTKTDEEVSRLFDIPFTTVAYRRARLGIAAFGKSDSTDSLTPATWEQVISQFAAKDDEVLAREFGVLIGVIRQRREIHNQVIRSKTAGLNLKDLVAAAGTDHDSEVAKKFGCRESLVLSQRLTNKIPRFTEQPTGLEADFGKMPDAEVGRRHSVSTPAIRTLREKCGVPVFKEKPGGRARRKSSIEQGGRISNGKRTAPMSKLSSLNTLSALWR